MGMPLRSTVMVGGGDTVFLHLSTYFTLKTVYILIWQKLKLKNSQIFAVIKDKVLCIT